MGERKGQNMYYPPDYDPGKGGLNKSQGTHALRERARKLHLGILIIRFEMPYNIWCEGCGNHIGMGVRYNAEKKKVGMYYTTPIYLFRMKCHLCDNHFEIRTDPANLDYEIISGARRQEKRFQAEENGTVVPDEKSSIAKLATDSMFKLKHEGVDKRKGKDAAPTIAKIVQIQDRAKDDYSANRQLRDNMRLKRKASKSVEISNSDLMKRSSLQGSNVSLLPENSEDSKTAALLRLAPAMSSEEKRIETRKEIMENESIFSPSKLCSNTTSESIYKSSKAQKIESFKKMVSKKKRNEGNPIQSIDLGVRKKVTIEKVNESQVKQNSLPIKIQSEIVQENRAKDIMDPIHLTEQDINIDAPNKSSHYEDKKFQHKNDSLCVTSDENINNSEVSTACQNFPEHSKPLSLSLLSCDYESSTNSSDND